MKRASTAALIVVLIGILVWAWSPPVRAAGAESGLPDLTDIKGHWAQKYIHDLTGFGIIGGYPDNTFRPDNSITRAEFVKLAVLADLTNPSDPTSRASTAGLPVGTPVPFADTTGHWSQSQGFLQQAIAWKLIVPEEYADGRFEPDRRITRLEMAVILVRAIGKDGEARQAAATGAVAVAGDVELSFADRDDIPVARRGYVKVAADKGMIGGYPDKTFRPAGNATRAEAAKMISKRFEASYTWACYTHHATGATGTEGGNGKTVPATGPTGFNGSLSVTVLAVRASATAAPSRVGGAKLQLQPGGYTATTTARGEAVFTSLPPAAYRLQVEAPGFETYDETKKVQVLPRTANETQVALFPTAAGEPVANLEVVGDAGAATASDSGMATGGGPSASATAQTPYNTAITLSAAGSRNASRTGFSWDIRDAAGQVVTDPYAVKAGAALAPQPASTETDDPVTFTLTLPAAGEYTVRLSLTNPAFPGVVSTATLAVKALNTKPEAVASVVAGPAPVKKTPDAALTKSSGLRVVKAGEAVWLRGWGIDPNVPSPELYNAGGNAPDIYGKNHDHYQRQFRWHWTLAYARAAEAAVEPAAAATATAAPASATAAPATAPTAWQDVSSLLDNPAAQYPKFTAAETGTYRATLVVDDDDAGGSLSSDPASVDILVLGDVASGGATATVSDSVCQTCHANEAEGWAGTAHGKLATGGTGASASTPGCQTCHGPGGQHVATASAVAATSGATTSATIAATATAADLTLIKDTISVTYGAGLCGNCHQEYGQWQKARHSDGDSYGYGEVAPALLLNCTGCHYAKGHVQRTEMAAARGKAFFEVNFSPLDRDKLPAKDEPGITCVACHDPHPAPAATTAASTSQVAAAATSSTATTLSPTANPASLVHGSSGNTCDTCHYEKWQNAILEGMAGEIKNGYEYPGRDYSYTNPHKTEDKCVLCHMSTAAPASASSAAAGAANGAATNANGILLVGGHTLRMRDAGPDGLVGGYGPRADDPSLERNPADTDDTLNVVPCQTCHPGLDTFDRNGVQKRIYDQWVLLGDLLKERNGGVLPGTKPGDKCATCHRGGTLPFDDDPELILENAYTNYKLVMNDRSWGIHNPKYVEALLDDSIASVREKYVPTRR